MFFFPPPYWISFSVREPSETNAHSLLHLSECVTRVIYQIVKSLSPNNNRCGEPTLQSWTDNFVLWVYVAFKNRISSFKSYWVQDVPKRTIKQNTLWEGALLWLKGCYPMSSCPVTKYKKKQWWISSAQEPANGWLASSWRAASICSTQSVRCLYKTELQSWSEKICLLLFMNTTLHL